MTRRPLSKPSRLWAAALLLAWLVGHVSSDRHVARAARLPSVETYADRSFVLEALLRDFALRDRLATSGICEIVPSAITEHDTDRDGVLSLHETKRAVRQIEAESQQYRSFSQLLDVVLIVPDLFRRWFCC
jgi:hypothetical protein